jgi:hypothetical protein
VKKITTLFSYLLHTLLSFFTLLCIRSFTILVRTVLSFFTLLCIRPFTILVLSFLLYFVFAPLPFLFALFFPFSITLYSPLYHSCSHCSFLFPLLCIRPFTILVRTVLSFLTLLCIRPFAMFFRTVLSFLLYFVFAPLPFLFALLFSFSSLLLSNSRPYLKIILKQLVREISVRHVCVAAFQRFSNVSDFNKTATEALFHLPYSSFSHIH